MPLHGELQVSWFVSANLFINCMHKKHVNHCPDVIYSQLPMAFSFNGYNIIYLIIISIIVSLNNLAARFGSSEKTQTVSLTRQLYTKRTRTTLLVDQAQDFLATH